MDYEVCSHRYHWFTSLMHRIGIISSLAFCPDYSGLYAAGTFSSSIGLLSEETGEDILLYLDDVPGPVTQVQVTVIWGGGSL
jgi:hypothetical protein